MNGRVRPPQLGWPWKLLAVAVTVAAGCVSVTVHAYPGWRLNWWEWASAFAFGASVAGFVCWLGVRMWAARHTVDVLTAEAGEPVVDTVPLPLSGVVRVEQGRVYGRRRPYLGNEGRRTEAGR